MVQKIVGYTELEWVCQNCMTRNPGPQKVCSGCGAPQPADVKFQKRQRDELLTDADKIEKAKAGPDIHCPYCGVRNTAEARVCRNCGGDLEKAEQRQTGQVLGAYQSGPAATVTCPHCGSPNPDTNYSCSNCGGTLTTAPEPLKPISEKPAKKMSPVMLVLGGLGLVALCAVAIFLFSMLSRTKDMTGKVSTREWQRSVVIQQFGPVNKTGWADQIPSNAQVGNCELKYHHTQNQPGDNAREVCGTPYTKDTGSGYGQVVQDCVYEIYMNYCNYTVDAWSNFDTVSVNGIDNQSYWPQTNLTQNQRQGDKSESYQITFSTPDGVRTYTTNSEALYNAATVGSNWKLTVNAFGNITDISH